MSYFYVSPHPLRPNKISPKRDRTIPSGYKVSSIAFSPTDGQPVSPPNSTTAYTDIFYNADQSKCAANCFRPVGMAFDRQGRLFVSSDASGEIYVLVQSGGGGGRGGQV